MSPLLHPLRQALSRSFRFLSSKLDGKLGCALSALLAILFCVMSVLHFFRFFQML